MSTSSPLRDLAGTLVLVGAGKMGGAMLEGWLALGLDPRRAVIVEPRPSPEIAALDARGVRLNPPLESVTDAAVVIIAVKPQVAPEAVPALKALIRPATVAVSVMAGKTMGFLESALSPESAIIRAMPNTPASIGRGITVAVPNRNVTAAQRALTDTLLRATGKVEWADDEALIDAVTAVSGSGPAYVFLLAEALARAGAAAGLPPDLAERLARETVAGAGELLHRSPLPASTLRENVTSPNGTTAAALGVLMAPDGMDPLLEKAVAAAANRSRELAG
jgi:pyrroline-5-carboxylate reductase